MALAQAFRCASRRAPSGIPSVFCRAQMSGAAASPAAGPKFHLLSYQYIPDILEKRGPFREAHLAGARKQLEAGKMVMGGACGNPVHGALFVFKSASSEDIEAFIQADPYVQNGLVTSWSVEPYAIAIGNF